MNRLVATPALTKVPISLVKCIKGFGLPTSMIFVDGGR
jgi:hypothetical protein